MNKNHIRADFVPDHNQFTTDQGNTFEFGTTAPYDYLLGALAGCLFSTFVDLAGKMKVSWEHVSLEVDGTKREESPTTLEQCTVAATATGVEDEKKFLKAFETATRYCSIYQTISKVSEMHWSVDFQ